MCIRDRPPTDHNLSHNREFGYVQRHVRKTSIDERRVRHTRFSCADPIADHITSRRSDVRTPLLKYHPPPTSWATTLSTTLLCPITLLTPHSSSRLERSRRNSSSNYHTSINLNYPLTSRPSILTMIRSYPLLARSSSNSPFHLSVRP